MTTPENKKGKKDSVRIQMYPSTKAYIEKVAEQYNCIRGQGSKISELLEQIEKGKLVIKEVIFDREDLVDRFSIGLEIFVPKNLKGIVVIVSDIIASYKANIFRIKTKLNGTKGIVQLLLVLPTESRLKDLVSSLQNIKVEEIEQFYKEGELDLAIASSIPYRVPPDVAVRQFRHGNLISDITCIIGFELRAKNEVGVLSKVSRKITEAGLLISSIDERVCNNPDEAVMKLFLYVHAVSNDLMLDHLGRIDLIFKELKVMPEVINVQRLGVNSFD